jgi:hypothetical protein
MNSDRLDSWTIRNQKYKIIANLSGTQEMYNLQTDTYENINLLSSSLSNEENTAKNELETEINEIRTKIIKLISNFYIKKDVYN